MKKINLFTKNSIFFWKNKKTLLSYNDETATNKVIEKKNFANKIQSNEVKILDIKRRVENNEIQLEELSYEQQEMLLKAYEIQKQNLENSILNLNHKLNKISE